MYRLITRFARRHEGYAGYLEESRKEENQGVIGSAGV